MALKQQLQSKEIQLSSMKKELLSQTKAIEVMQRHCREADRLLAVLQAAGIVSQSQIDNVRALFDETR